MHGPPKLFRVFVLGWFLLSQATTSSGFLCTVFLRFVRAYPVNSLQLRLGVDTINKHFGKAWGPWSCRHESPHSCYPGQDMFPASLDLSANAAFKFLPAGFGRFGREHGGLGLSQKAPPPPTPAHFIPVLRAENVPLPA